MNLTEQKVSESTFGKIYYWHHESALDTPDTLIAEFFSDFIITLFIEHDEEVADPLSDEELIRVNTNRSKIGLPPIDRSKNVV